MADTPELWVTCPTCHGHWSPLDADGKHYIYCERCVPEGYALHPGIVRVLFDEAVERMTAWDLAQTAEYQQTPGFRSMFNAANAERLRAAMGEET